MASHSDYGFVRGVLAIGVVSILGCNQLIGFKDVSLQGDATNSHSDDDAPMDGSSTSHDAGHDGPPPQVFAFVTDASTDGGFGAAMGSRIAADKRCKDMYDLTFQSLNCTNVRAVVQIDDASDSLAGMQTKFSIPNTSVKRATDGVVVISSWESFVDPNLQLAAPISTGTPPQRFWSGRAGGSNLKCNGWVSSANADFGTAGDATKTLDWSAQANIHCDSIEPRLVCACW